MSRFPPTPTGSSRESSTRCCSAARWRTRRASASSTAFKAPDGSPLFDSGRIYYDSDGMGGNFGTVATAMAPDWDRAVLGTTGMRYSLISQRSTAFDRFNELLLQSYSGRIQRMVVLALAQTLWDRGEADGYAARITGDPPPNTPIHDVLIQTALGDHQTPQISSEILARTAETSVATRPTTPAATPDKIPFYGSTRRRGSSSGRASRCGTAGRSAPAGSAPTWRRSPTSRSLRAPTRTRSSPATQAARTQKSAFLQPIGRMLDVCPPQRACRTDSFPY